MPCQAVRQTIPIRPKHFPIHASPRNVAQIKGVSFCPNSATVK